MKSTGLFNRKVIVYVFRTIICMIINQNTWSNKTVLIGSPVLPHEKLKLILHYVDDTLILCSIIVFRIEYLHQVLQTTTLQLVAAMFTFPSCPDWTHLFPAPGLHFPLPLDRK